MKVIIRNPRRRELEIQGRRRVADLLGELGLNPEAHVVIRGEELLTRDEWLEDADTVEIVAAISGGQG